jgi:hypothetical protein
VNEPLPSAHEQDRSRRKPDIRASPSGERHHSVCGARRLNPARHAFGCQALRLPALGANLASSQPMYSGGSLALIALGAILYWAVNYHIAGINLHLVGAIFMIIGAIGFVFGLLPHRRV